MANVYIIDFYWRLNETFKFSILTNYHRFQYFKSLIQIRCYKKNYLFLRSTSVTTIRDTGYSCKTSLELHERIYNIVISVHYIKNYMGHLTSGRAIVHWDTPRSLVMKHPRFRSWIADHKSLGPLWRCWCTRFQCGFLRLTCFLFFFFFLCVYVVSDCGQSILTNNDCLVGQDWVKLHKPLCLIRYLHWLRSATSTAPFSFHGTEAVKKR